MSCPRRPTAVSPSIEQASSSETGSVNTSVPPSDDKLCESEEEDKDKGPSRCDSRTSSPAAPKQNITFRVTGAASAARLEPLLLGGGRGGGTLQEERRFPWSRAANDDISGRIDFVWETTATRSQRNQHRDAKVLNRLSGAQVFEDKANLALIQRLMKVPTLESYIVRGKMQAAHWARLRFGSPANENSLSPSPRSSATAGGPCEDPPKEDDWWCVKAAGANGGMDVWVMHSTNWALVTSNLQDNEVYVIQRYVVKPMLWRNRKFHFRCYAAVTANMSAWLYRKAYILCASRPYSMGPGGGAGPCASGNIVDELVHITNLAVNKHTDDHPGQVAADLPVQYPHLWPRMVELLRSLVQAAAPFMQHQARLEHFEFLGLDLIADDAGRVWLLEVNRLPGLQSSKQNEEDENTMYDRMMLDLIDLLVVPPLMHCSPDPGLFEAAAAPNPDATAPSRETWRNVMRFAAFKRSCKKEFTSPLM